ncbi:MAG: hypothetical protein JWP80_701 [Pseudomonas sp.]|nr:hypothetical protein [Pseudomonas sp.]
MLRAIPSRSCRRLRSTENRSQDFEMHEAPSGLIAAFGSSYRVMRSFGVIAPQPLR